MNSFFQGSGEAVIHYGDADFTIMEGGAYVTCASTGQKIQLEKLRYWSAERQEPYRDAAASLAAWKKANA